MALKIRKEQFEAFLPQNDQEITDFIIRHLSETSSELIDRILPDGLQEMVRNGIVRARGHGLRSLSNLTAFVSLMFEIAPNFDVHPAICRVLCDNTVPEEKRLDKLFENEMNDAWEQVAENYEPEAWARAWFSELSWSEE